MLRHFSNYLGYFPAQLRTFSVQVYAIVRAYNKQYFDGKDYVINCKENFKFKKATKRMVLANSSVRATL